MKKFSSYFFLLILSAFIFLSAWSADRKPWTFLVYLAAANDLYPFAQRDIDEMMKIGSNENVTIIVYLTIQSDFGPKETIRLVVNKGSVTQVGGVSSEDSGDVNTLMKALQWAESDFPSDHSAVVLWDHGSGPLNRTGTPQYLRGICYDYDTNNYLTDRDLLHAFSWGKNNLRNGKKYDIIACDACLMASIEVAYTLADCADYFVASQENIPGDGYEYAKVLDEFNHSIPNPEDFARSMVEAYNEEYEGTIDFTLSAVDLLQLKHIIPELNEMNTSLIKALNSIKSKKVKKVIKKCISLNKCPCFDDGQYADVYNFCKNIKMYASKMKLSKKDKKQLKKLSSNVYKKLRRSIITKVSSSSYKKAGGLSVYFPEYHIDKSYSYLYWSENSNWLKFLENYFD